MGLVIVIKLDRGWRVQVEGDVVAARYAMQTIIFVPAVIQRGLILPVARGYRESTLPHVVGSVVGEMGRGTRGVPVAWATKLTLEVAHDGHACGIGCGRCGGRSRT